MGLHGAEGFIWDPIFPGPLSNEKDSELGGWGKGCLEGQLHGPGESLG